MNKKALLPITAAALLALASCGGTPSTDQTSNSGVDPAGSSSGVSSSGDASSASLGRSFPLTSSDSQTDEGFEKWKKSADAADYNGDGQIDEKDYAVFLWLDSDDAADYNGDRKINYVDYSLLQDFNAWKKGEDAADYNGDSKITFDDYLAFREYASWKESDKTADFDGNGAIDYDDYLIYTPFAKWLDGTDARDVNGDGTIGYEDYILLNEFNAWRASDAARDYSEDRIINYDDYLIHLAFMAWKNSDKAMDIDNDLSITYADYVAYLKYAEWKEGDDAIDLNSDGVIDYQDYVIFTSEGYQNYLVWKKSEWAKDYDESGSVDEADYEIYLAFRAWLESDAADDINKDRVIDYADHVASQHPELTPYEIWRGSHNAKDYDGNGEINETDFAIFNLIGDYRVSQLLVEGARLYFADSRLSLNDVAKHIEDAVIRFDGSKTKVELNGYFIDALSQADKKEIETIADSIVINVETATLMTVTMNIPFPQAGEQGLPLTLYFKLNETPLESTIKVSFPYGDSTLNTFVTLTLEKIEQ